MPQAYDDEVYRDVIPALNLLEDAGDGVQCQDADRARPEAVRQMKASAGRDLVVGGPDLAAQAIRAGLVDEYHLFVAAVVVGGGKQSLPDNVRFMLELLNERRGGNGMVFLRYHA